MAIIKFIQILIIVFTLKSKKKQIFSKKGKLLSKFLISLPSNCKFSSK